MAAGDHNICYLTLSEYLRSSLSGSNRPVRHLVWGNWVMWQRTVNDGYRDVAFCRIGTVDKYAFVSLDRVPFVGYYDIFFFSRLYKSPPPCGMFTLSITICNSVRKVCGSGACPNVWRRAITAMIMDPGLGQTTLIYPILIVLYFFPKRSSQPSWISLCIPCDNRHDDSLRSLLVIYRTTECRSFCSYLSYFSYTHFTISFLLIGLTV